MTTDSTDSPVNPDIPMSLELLEAERLNPPESPAQLADDIFKLVKFRMGTRAAAVKLVELNRRYGVSAKKLGTSTRNCVEELVKQSRVDVVSYCGCLLVYDYAGMQRLLEPLRQPIKPPGGGPMILPNSEKIQSRFHQILKAAFGDKMDID